jgi:hypothetical protein
MSDWWAARKERWRSSRRRPDDETAEETARRVVKQAAAILEDEVASGIGAVKKVERRMINVQSIRAKNPDAVIHRFRRDAHEVVDILVDLAGAAIDSVGAAARRAVEIRGEVSDAAQVGVVTLSVPDTVSAGDSAEVAMLVENDGESETEVFQLTSSDFVSSSGSRIPSGQVTFSPEPIQIAPQATQRVALRVRIPPDSAPGVYTGVVQATKLEHVRAVVVVTVGEASAGTPSETPDTGADDADASDGP